MMKCWMFAVQAMEDRRGNTAEIGALHHDGIVLVALPHQGLKAEAVAAARQANDTMGAVRQVLHEFNHAPAKRERRRTGIAHVVDRLTRLHHQVIDAVLNGSEQRRVQPREEYGLPHAAVGACIAMEKFVTHAVGARWNGRF